MKRIVFAAMCMVVCGTVFAQGFRSGTVTRNGVPNWMEYPDAADNGKVLTYDSALRQAIWSAIGGTLSGLTSTRVLYATGATTAAGDEGMTYVAATDALTVVGSVSSADFLALTPGITTTLTDAVSLANVTPSTAGVRVQQSPAIRWEGHAWETTGGTDDKFEWYNFVLPVTGAPAFSAMYWRHSKEGAAATTPMTLTSAGSLTAASAITAGGYIVAGTGVIANMPTESTTASTYAIKVPAITGANNNEVAVLGASTARTFRRAVVADTGLVVLGVKSSSWSGGLDGMYASYVYVDNAAVAIGDTLVVSTAADGAAMTNNATTTPKLILGYATEARTAANIETYQSHTTATPGVVTVTAPTAFTSNQRVVLMGGTFGGLTQGAAYFVRNPSGSTFELSLTAGGASLALTSAAATGSPTFVPTNLISFWMK